MCLYAYANILPGSWPEEGTVSVVPRSRLIGGAVVGDTCSLNVGRCTHPGKLVASKKEERRSLSVLAASCFKVINFKI